MEYSVITCAPDDEKFSRFVRRYRRALAGEEYEIIRISDARSLAEGYLRGQSRAKGKIVIFSHDDAAPLRPIGARLRDHLRHADIIGGAGTNRLESAIWFSAGPPHVFGSVLNRTTTFARDRQGNPAYRDGDLIQIGAWQLCAFGIPSRRVDRMQAMDGFWIACNRDVLCPGAACWDPQTCDGFHLYDLDFTFGAYLHGINVAVATDLYLFHEVKVKSEGYYSPGWQKAADRWLMKHGDDLLPRRNGREFGIGSVVDPSLRKMLAVMDAFARQCD